MYGGDGLGGLLQLSDSIHEGSNSAFALTSPLCLCLKNFAELDNCNCHKLETNCRYMATKVLNTQSKSLLTSHADSHAEQQGFGYFFE